MDPPGGPAALPGRWRIVSAAISAKSASWPPWARPAGNVGAVYFRLSQPPEPGKEVVVNFSRDAGDKSINLVEGSRLVFTESNWNKPAIALIQLDPKLQSEATGSYGPAPATSLLVGHLYRPRHPLSHLFFYHGFALPRPASDVGVQSRNFLREFFNTFVSPFSGASTSAPSSPSCSSTASARRSWSSSSTPSCSTAVNLGDWA